MMELALSDTNEPITVKTIAKRQSISGKYLEQIVSVLNRAGFVKSERGAQGGYRLARPADTYTVGDILSLIEGSLKPVACLDENPNTCPRADACAPLELWEQVDAAVSGVVNAVTLAELADRQRALDENGANPASAV